jgi:protein phosphatase
MTLMPALARSPVAAPAAHGCTSEFLHRLKSRGLAGKRSLAAREFALGLEALERFVHREPLRRVHECVFGVLALESEPVDPRL